MEAIAEKLRARPDFRFLELERRVKEDDLGFSSMVDALSHSTTIRYIYICGKFLDSLCQDQRRVLFAAIQDLSSLRALYLANTKLTAGTVKDLANLLLSCKAPIQELSFQHLHIADGVTLDPVVTAAAKLCSLEKIELGVLFMYNNVPACTKESLIQLCRSTSLETLTLIDLNLDQEHIVCMSQEIGRNDTLEKLHIWGENAGSSLYDLATMMERVTNLHTLCLYFANIDREGMKFLLKSLGRSTAIRNLSIEHMGYSIQQESILALSRTLEDNQQLESLSLASKCLEGEGCKTLCQSLACHKGIKELNLDNLMDKEDDGSLSGNSETVDTGDIKAICNLMRANQVIERLDVSGIPLGEAGVISLVTALQENSTVRELTIASFRKEHEMNNTRPGRDRNRALVAIETMLEQNRTLGNLVIEGDENWLDREERTRVLLSLNESNLRTLMMGINSTRDAFVNTLSTRVYDISSVFYLLKMNPTVMNPSAPPAP